MTEGTLIIGQIYKLGSPDEKYEDFDSLIRGGLKIGYGQAAMGIFSPAAFKLGGLKYKGQPFIPFFILDSNSFKYGTADNPWKDDFWIEEGFVLYHGDSKEGKDIFSSTGNRKILGVLEQYFNPELKALAPPMLVTRHVEVNGNKKGYRKIVGYGYPEKTYVEVQREKNSGKYFTNLKIKVLLLSKEQEEVSMAWLDDRRDHGLSPAEMLRNAPLAWKKWLNN